jgi:hypothetical protein
VEEDLIMAPNQLFYQLLVVALVLIRLLIQVGERTLAMAQAALHQIAQRLAPGCVPLFLSDGYPPYLHAIVTHFEHWVQPPRRQATGPAPKPRWMPLPALLYAQVIKTTRRRRPGTRQSPCGLRDV